MSAREVQFIWHLYPGAHTIDKQHVRTYLNRLNRESFEDSITLSTFNNMDWTINTIQRSVCTTPQKWQHLRRNASQNTGASWSLPSEKTWWNGNRNKPKDNGTMQIGSHLHLSYFPPDIFSDSTIVAWTIWKRKIKLPVPMHIWEQEDFHQHHIGRQLAVCLQLYFPVVWDRKCGGYTEKTVRRRGYQPRLRETALLWLSVASFVVCVVPSAVMIFDGSFDFWTVSCSSWVKSPAFESTMNSFSTREFCSFGTCQ